jgi:hypothetical protein
MPRAPEEASPAARASAARRKAGGRQPQRRVGKMWEASRG